MASNDWKARIAHKGAKTALENFATVTHGATGIAAAFKGLLPFFTSDDAKDVYLHTQALICERNKSRGIKTTKVEYKKSRGSEIASVLKLRDWTCHNQLLDMLATLEAPRDTIVFVAREVRKGAGKIEKNAPCPKRDIVVKWINSRKSQRNNSGESSNRKINPVVAITAIGEHLKKLSATYGKADGGSFISAMLKACKSYAPYAKSIVEASKAAAEEAKPKKAAKKGGAK